MLKPVLYFDIMVYGVYISLVYIYLYYKSFLKNWISITKAIFYLLLKPIFLEFVGILSNNRHSR